MGCLSCSPWLFECIESLCISFFKMQNSPLRHLPHIIDGLLLFKLPSICLHPSAALSNCCFQKLEGAGQGKAFLLIFLYGLICKERGKLSSRQVGEQDGGQHQQAFPEGPPSLAPWLRAVMWVLELSGTAQQPSGVDSPMACAPPSLRWGRGQLLYDTFGILPVDAGTGAPHCQNALEAV